MESFLQKMVEINSWHGKTYPEYVSSATKSNMEWRDANSGPQRWKENILFNIYFLLVQIYFDCLTFLL